ncbi:transposase [Clostridium tagluense]|nr:transposase [Clostridium tagluense]
MWDKYFKRIRILDSTAFQVPESYKDIYPGSGGCSQASGVKIQLEYELKSGNLLNMKVGAGSEGDNTFGSKIRDTIKSGDLILRDLGYFNFEGFFKHRKERSPLYIETQT